MMLWALFLLGPLLLRLVFLVTSFFRSSFLCIPFQRTQAYLANNIYKFRLHLFWLIAYYFNSFQHLRPYTFFVLLLYFNYTFNGNRVMFCALRHGIPHQVSKDI